MKAIALFVAVIPAIAVAQPSLQVTGSLPGNGQLSHAFGVAGDGSKVVGVSSPSGFFEPFVWTEQTGIFRMPTLPNTVGYTPYAATLTGEYVYGTFGPVGGGTVGFVWSKATGVLSIGDLPGGRTDSWLAHVTEGEVAGVGASSYGFNSIGAPLYRAIKWSASNGLETLPLPNAADETLNSRAYRTLDDGRIFGQSASGAWLYSERAGYEMLPGAESMTHCSPDGSFFAGTANVNGSRPAVWTAEDGLTLLPLFDDHSSGNLRGMSNDGSIIVGVSSGPREVDEVVWLNQGEPITIKDYATSLGIDMSKWIIVDVFGVSADGSSIVGTAARTDWGVGHLEGFVLTTSTPQPPCPADTNNDGTLSPADFTAWIAAFNATSDACDQNDDGLCSPADFTAWIANYNAGC